MDTVLKWIKVEWFFKNGIQVRSAKEDEQRPFSQQRSANFAGRRRIPLNVRGQSLLAGHVFCGHCGARLSLTTNGKGRVRQDGTDAVRVRYVCQTKTRKHEPCGGQTGYTLTKLDGIINDIVHQIFGKVKSFRKSELLGLGHKAKMDERATLLRRAQREYEKAEKDLQGLKLEVVKAIQGKSAFAPDLLNSLIQENEQKCHVLKENYFAAQRAVEETELLMNDLNVQYNQMIEWSKVFDTANMETRKMIVAELIERVDVFRDYKLKIKFTISVEQFMLGLDVSA